MGNCRVTARFVGVITEKGARQGETGARGSEFLRPSPLRHRAPFLVAFQNGLRSVESIKVYLPIRFRYACASRSKTSLDQSLVDKPDSQN